MYQKVVSLADFTFLWISEEKTSKTNQTHCGLPGRQCELPEMGNFVKEFIHEFTPIIIINSFL
jgi:hypothetical protein